MKPDSSANILFVSSYPLPIEKGSNQHAFFLMKALAERYNVYCLFFKQRSTSPADSDKALLDEIGIKDLCVLRCPEIKFHNEIHKRIVQALSFPYFHAKAFYTPHNTESIRQYLVEKQITVVHIESLHYAGFMWHLPDKVKKVFVYHDLHHKIFFEQIRYVKKYYNRINPFLDGLKVLLFEKMINRKSDLKIFLNPDEMLFSPHKSAHIPHIVNPEITAQVPTPDKKPINIFFLGGYQHPPNKVALDLIIGKILPMLLKQSSCAWEFHLIGKGTEQLTPLIKRTGLEDKIRFRGFVENINDVFKRMDIALFPIPYGGGIKTKIIESMAAGVPVVTTESGVYGLKNLNERCINVCESPSEIADAVIQLMHDDRLRLDQSRAAISYIQNNHAYQIMKNVLLDAYKRIA